MTTPDSIALADDQKAPQKNFRQIKVSYTRRQSDYSPMPAVHLTGHWLEAAGFATGTEVDVRITDGCIVLLAKQPEPELEQAMRQMNKLSARKQKQVQEFISVITAKPAKSS
ncbi:endoribonuclease SymE [Superficieibacter sp. HKU1]|uniref:endoribonuclease SymE n=1 Tax=Superficieibacter sp. HKU1 TaxID=3031919 RepID=UPI0023E151F1|nr:endoribonuclease SymE [Superficieibacter sp. HKU1]WES69089.1 endoribonuclease SymE [Superficieibacter sp. HKU1]